MKDKLLTKIYNNLPLFLQNLAISAFGYKWKKRRLGGIFQEEVLHFKSRESYTKENWIDYQTSELQKLLIHAYHHVPYYKRIFNTLNIVETDLSSFTVGDLQQLPLLTKEDLRKYGQTDLISDAPEKGSTFFSSSGSTGTPVNIFISERMHQRYSAMAEIRSKHWAGLTYKNSRGMIGGRRIIADADNNGPFYRYNHFEKQAYFSAYHISAKTAPAYLEGIKKHKLDYMTGYAVSNYVLARFFKELKLDVPQLKAVITSSEKLTAEMRQLMAEVYQCKVFDGYSGVECCAVITECEQGKLHISPDVGIIELIKEDGSFAMPGEAGEIVATGLLNFNQPLIRYKTGDSIIIDTEPCPCKRNMPVVKEILGRVEDLVIGKDGREMVRFHGIFVNLPNVIEGQIVQNDYSDFEINIVTKTGLSEAEKLTIKQRMTSQLGEIKLEIHELDQIPRGANGKFKAVISKMSRTPVC